ncbi:MAG: DUF4118 domain-containing protein, partial [Spirochaetaceae bacterium]|nr:DUF4118 domain-containing protein [Spirochaetaceae bacterium]
MLVLVDMDGDSPARAEPGPGGYYLVAVTGSGNSEYLIRWTSATARRLGATWAAIHVRGSAPEPDPPALEKNLTLARSLGAEVFSVPDDDIAASIVRYARVKKATALVIGKSMDGIASLLGKRSVMDAILRGSGDLDLIVLRGKNPIPFRRRPVAIPSMAPRFRDFAISLPALALVTALGILAQPVLGYRSVSILYLLVIISLPFTCGRVAVFASAALSALLWNFLFIPPKLTFSIASLEDILMYAAFFLAAFVGGFLTSRLKEKEAALSLREKRTALLYGFTRSLSRVRGVGEIAALGAVYIAAHMDSGIRVWLCDSAGELDFGRSLGAEGSYAGDARRDEELVRKCLASKEIIADGDDRLFMPLEVPDSAIGVIAVTSEARRSLGGESRELLATLAGNMALAFEREMLAAANEEHKLVEESARLSRVLLNHVSHELRTPLTMIKGSVSGLLDGSVDDDPELATELLSETLTAADKLDGLVEDLLSMSRLETGSLRPRLEKTDVAELLGAAQSTLAAELRGREIRLGRSCAEAEFEVDPAL